MPPKSIRTVKPDYSIALFSDRPEGVHPPHATTYKRAHRVPTMPTTPTFKLDLSYLSPSDRVLVAHAVSGVPRAEIAARVEMTEGRVKHRLLNAVRLLKEVGQNTDELERSLNPTRT